MNEPATLRALHGDKVAAAIQELHDHENDLAGALFDLADRHAVDHEIFHVARDIATWSREHVRRLAEVGAGYGLRLDPEAQHEVTLAARVRRQGAQLTGRFHEPALLLLADLRHLHQLAAGVSLDWEVLAQSAQAMKDRDLLELARECQAHSERQLTWAKAQVKVTAAQSLVTG